MIVEMGLFFTASVLWFLCFSFVIHFSSSFPLLLFSFRFLLPALFPFSPSFLLSQNHWMSEPKETLSDQVQHTCLPSGKPRSRKLQPRIVGPSRRAWPGSQWYSASCRGGLGAFPPWISAIFRLSPAPEFSTPLTSGTCSTGRGHSGWDMGWKALSKLFRPVEVVEKPTTFRLYWEIFKSVFWRIQYVSTRRLCNSTLGTSVRKCSQCAQRSLPTVAFSEALFVLANAGQKHGNSLNIYQ